ncbi:MAG TPA: DUF1697 domain-containing protein [Woeseiaceae bacterium]|nr:DUF1697 domain-containing protein [Woeseiaceae bacterium]
MAATRYIALLRGINVGGGNIIRMADLKACFEASKLRNVSTYIQSGNVLFESAETNQAKLAKKLETALSTEFYPYKARIVLRSHAELAEIVRGAPRGFGHEPEKYRYDVIYLKEPMTASEAMHSVTAREGVDEVASGRGVLYFSRLIAKAGQSHLARVVSLPVYQHMTIRNWNTTSKLLTLLDTRTRGHGN